MEKRTLYKNNRSLKFCGACAAGFILLVLISAIMGLSAAALVFGLLTVPFLIMFFNEFKKLRKVQSMNDGEYARFLEQEEADYIDGLKGANQVESEREEQEAIAEAERNKTLHCPACGSDNISTAESMKFSGFFSTAGSSGGKTRKCNDCGCKWNMTK